jgi:diguanylate cyclase (GGDEF)-like protein
MKLSAVTRWVLGPSGRQRLRVSQTLLSFTVFVVFAGIQHAEVLMGLIDRAQSNLLSAYNLIGAALFYLVIRTGLNERWRGDPALTAPQIAFALVSVAWSYGITGPARGAVLSIMVLVLLFGMFALGAQQVRQLALFGFMTMVIVMAWKARTDPVRYPPAVERVHFAFALIVTASVAALTLRFGRLRERLVAQRGELTQALERIRELATRDELTGLYNRRAVGELLQREVERCGREDRPLALVLIDIDHFKRINDQYGHRVGDLALQHFAQLACSELRGSTDVVARWGGEEFLLVLPDTSSPAAVACVARLREHALKLPLSNVSAQLVINFSAGVSLCRGVDDVEAAVERADQAMYQAKSQGRGRTCES